MLPEDNRGSGERLNGGRGEGTGKSEARLGGETSYEPGPVICLYPNWRFAYHPTPS